MFVKRVLAVTAAIVAALVVLGLVAKAPLLAYAKSIPDWYAPAQSSLTLVGGAEQPRMADAFVDSIGVNVHLNDAATNYDQRYDRFRALLVASGIRHLRDGLIASPSAAYYPRLSELAHAGVHADLITSIGQPSTLWQSIPARMQPHTIDAIEGPNEFDMAHQSDWALMLAGFQHRLYTVAHAMPALSGAMVIGPSLTSASAYDDVGDMSMVLDAGNVHPYPAGHEPGTPGFGVLGSWTARGSLATNLANARKASGTKPLIVTETGYGDAPLAAEGVPPDVKARYTTRVLFETWNAGVTRTYLYQFLDAGIDGFQTYGLIDDALKPKPAYTAVASLIAHLRDPGRPFALTPLTYTLVGSTRLHHTLLQRRDRSYALALWLSIPSWNTGSHQPIATEPQPATLTFPAGARDLRTTTIGDSGVAATQSYGTERSLTLPVTGNVTIVDIR